MKKVHIHAKSTRTSCNDLLCFQTLQQQESNPSRHLEEIWHAVGCKPKHNKMIKPLYRFENICHKKSLQLKGPKYLITMYMYTSSYTITLPIMQLHICIYNISTSFLYRQYCHYMHPYRQPSSNRQVSAAPWSAPGSVESRNPRDLWWAATSYSQVPSPKQ